MRESKEAYYMVIPAKVWDTEISAGSVLTYGHISVLANKKGFCYASNSYFMKKLKCSVSTIKRYMNELEDLGLITRSVTYAKDSKEIEERRIYLVNPARSIDEPSPMVIDEPTGRVTNEPDNTTRFNTTRSNSKSNEILGKIFFKIVEVYPKNRIGNRQHGLKKFEKLDIQQAKLAGKNLKRYLNVAGKFVKNLQNYIEEECYTEEWLKLQEETNNKHKDITNTKTFDDNYDNIT